MPRALRAYFLLGGLAIFTGSALSQQPKSPPSSPAPSSPAPAQNLPSIFSDYAKTVAEDGKNYREFLTNETKSHEDFWERIIEKSFAAVGIVATAVAACLTYQGWTSKKKIRVEVESQFKAKVATLVQDKLDEFSRSMQTTQKEIADFRAFLSKTETDIASGSKRTDQLARLIDVASAMSCAAMVLAQPPNMSDGTSERTAIELLESVRNEAPGLRLLVVFLGRLYRAIGMLPKAKAVLQDACKARDNAGKKRDRDYAALLFNMACYSNLQARNLPANDPQVETLRGEAWQALKECVQISHENLKEAKADADLADLESGQRRWDDL